MATPLSSGSDFVYEFSCGQCEQNRRHLEAHGYCTDCQEYLCQSCFDTHLRPKPMRHHVLLDKTQMPTGKQQISSTDSGLGYCSKHPKKPMQLYCSQHEAFGCDDCIILEHRKCPDVDLIAEFASSRINTYFDEDMKFRLKDDIKTAVSAIQEIEKQMPHCEQLYTKTLEAFATLKKDVNNAMEALECKIHDEIGKLSNNNKKKLSTTYKTCRDIENQLHMTDSNLKKLKNNGQECQWFVSRKTAEKDIVSLEIRLKETLMETEVTEYELRKSPGIRELLNKSPDELVASFVPTSTRLPFQQLSDQLANTPRSSTRSNSECDKSLSNEGVNDTLPSKELMFERRIQAMQDNIAYIKQELGHMTTYLDNDRPITSPAQQDYNHEADIPISCSTDDATPQITGSIILSAAKLMVVDRGNRCLKLIDLTDITLVSMLDLQADIWDTALMSNGLVAVTSINKIFMVKVGWKVVHIKLGNKLALDHSLAIHGHSKGIASIDNKMIVSFYRPVKIELMDLNGQVLKRLDNPDNRLCRFLKPWYIATSKDNGTIYISDWHSDTMTALDLDGNVKATYGHKGSKVRAPMKLAVSKTGFLIVCGSLHHQIYILAPNLKTSFKLHQMSERQDAPVTVSYCSNTSRLFIGTTNNTIKVYKMK